MHKIIADIELDTKELKYLLELLSREPNHSLRSMIQRRITQLHTSLNRLSTELETPVTFNSTIEEDEPKSPLEETEQLHVDVPDMSNTVVLGEQLPKRSVDLRELFSLNDSFRFSGELFGGMERMERSIATIGQMTSVEDALHYLASEQIDEENETYADFLEILNKYFA